MVRCVLGLGFDFLSVFRMGAFAFFGIMCGCVVFLVWGCGFGAFYLLWFWWFVWFCFGGFFVLCWGVHYVGFLIFVGGEVFGWGEVLVVLFLIILLR